MPLAARDWWRDVLWFDEAIHRIAATGRGELWFVAGNYNAALLQAAERAEGLSHCVVVSAPVEPAAAGERHLANVVQATAAVLSPLAELAVALGRAALAGSSAPPPFDADLFTRFDEAVTAATSEGRTVVFLWNSGVMVDPMWTRLLAQVTARRGRLREQRLLLVVGVPDGGDMGKDATELVAEGKAHLVDVPPLSVEEVMAAVHAAKPVAQRLVTVTGGDDALARRRWAGWVDDRHVCRGRRGRWHFSGDGEDSVLAGVERVLAQALSADRSRIDEVEDALAFASLSDGEFCARAVAEGRDVLGDLERLACGEGAAPLLAPVRSSCTHYRFADPAVAAYFASTLGDGERAEVAERVLRRADALHGRVGDFDAALARLARTAGDEALLATVEARRAAAHEQAHLACMAAVLVSVGETWPADDLYLFTALSGVVDKLHLAVDPGPALPAARAAVELGRRHFTAPSDRLAWAVHQLGHIHADLGDHQAGLAWMQASLAEYDALGEDVSSKLHSAVANAWHCAAAAHREAGDRAAARRAVEEATRRYRLALQGQDSRITRRALARTVGFVGILHIDAGEPEQAVPLLDEALRMFSAGDEGARLPPTYRRMSSSLLYWAGVARRDAGVPGAAAAFRQAAAVLEPIDREAYEIPLVRLRLAGELPRLAAALREAGLSEEAAAVERGLARLRAP